MPNAIALRPDFDAPALRGLARRSKDAAQARRLLSLAVIYDGGSRTEAALLGNVTLQIVRDWVVRFNAEGPDGLRDRKAPGPTPLLNAAHRAALHRAGLDFLLQLQSRLGRHRRGSDEGADRGIHRGQSARQGRRRAGLLGPDHRAGAG